MGDRAANCAEAKAILLMQFNLIVNYLNKNYCKIDLLPYNFAWFDFNIITMISRNFGSSSAFLRFFGAWFFEVGFVLGLLPDDGLVFGQGLLHLGDDEVVHSKCL